MGVLCEEWEGTRLSNGYGQVTVDGGGQGWRSDRKGSRRGRRMLAHRWTWEQAHGPIPPGLEVMHSCDNPSCVNLDHLSLGTHAANMADMAAKGRAHGRSPWSTTATCKNGHLWTEENTYRPPKRPHHRHCRACGREAQRRSRQRVG